MNHQSINSLFNILVVLACVGVPAILYVVFDVVTYFLGL